MGRNPISGKLDVPIQISHGRLQAVGKRSRGQGLEAAYVLPEVLQSPAGIFEGLCWDRDEDTRGEGWRCYAGFPTCSYLADGRKQGPWQGEIFLVFINKEAVAYNWRWEKTNPHEPTMPEGHLERFKKRLL